ncbi:MAG: hypothetical protein EOS45_30050, partial [Mesorhizobium sp.]
PSRLRRATSPPIDGGEEGREPIAADARPTRLPFPPEGGKAALRSQRRIGASRSSNEQPMTK